MYQPLLAGQLHAASTRVRSTLLTLVETKLANKMMPAVMLIHLLAKYRSAAPVGLVDQKYATSRSKVITKS